MNFKIFAIHHYVKESGILIYSNVSILEWDSTNSSKWINHSFIRELQEYGALLEEEDEEDKDFLTLFLEYLSDPNNILALVLIGIIIVGTVVTIRTVNHRNLSRGYEEFKEIMRKKKINKKSKN